MKLFHDPLVDFKKRGYAQISYGYMHMWYICYCYFIAGHTLSALLYLKAKTLNILHLRGFLQLLQKVQVSGWYFGFCIPAKICNIEVKTSGSFYNLALILLAQRRRWWPSITPTLGQCIVLYGKCFWRRDGKHHPHNAAVSKHGTITQFCFNVDDCG